MKRLMMILALGIFFFSFASADYYVFQETPNSTSSTGNGDPTIEFNYSKPEGAIEGQWTLNYTLTNGTDTADIITISSTSNSACWNAYEDVLSMEFSFYYDNGKVLAKCFNGTGYEEIINKNVGNYGLVCGFSTSGSVGGGQFPYVYDGVYSTNKVFYSISQGNWWGRCGNPSLAGFQDESITWLIQEFDLSTIDNSNFVYLDVNNTYPLVLLPLDENIWDVNLNVYDGENWTTLDFPYNYGNEQYELDILFTQIGDFPFIINSDEVEGDITGVFRVRDAYDVTFRFFKSKQALPFFSNKYKNNYAYVTAELTGEKTFFTNAYDPYLEPFVFPLQDDRFLKDMWNAKYQNGVATLTLYEKDTEYAIRLMDGEILFAEEYSKPNITDSYGVNAYIGKYTFTGEDEEYSVLLSSKDLNPYGWLFNIILVAGVIMVIMVAIGMFFLIPQSPATAIIFLIGGFLCLLVLRGVVWIWLGW